MVFRRLASAAVACGLLCASIGLASEDAQDGSKQQIISLEQKWLGAEENPGVQATILADDFIHVLPVGFVTKQEQLAYLRSHPAPKRGSRHFAELRVRVFTNTAVANGIVATTDAAGRIRKTAFTDVFAYRNGKWQAVNAQELPLGESPAAAETSPLPPNLKKDVASGNQEWVEGFKAGNAARPVSAYSPDAVFCNPAGDCIKGKAAILAHYKDTIEKLGRATDASVQSDALRLDHDLAYESGRAEAHFAGGKVLQGRFSTVWKLQPDGHWKIFRNLSLPASQARVVNQEEETRSR